MKAYIKLMRPKHYLKNILIFVPLFFSGEFFNALLFIKSILAFVAFSLIASVVYIVNDIRDVKEDRKHITKRNRPVASGSISIKASGIYAAVLFMISIVLSYFISNTGVSLAALFTYFGINFLYSVARLKDIALIDILILAFGFLLRLYYGAAITNVVISPWLYLTVIVISFYLGLGKRRNELKNSEQNERTRPVLRYYTANFLDKNMYMCMALAIAFYSLWCMDVTTVEKYGPDYTIWTVPLVLIIAMKYSLIVEGNSDGDPIEVIFKDRWLLILSTVYAIIMYLIIY